MENANFDQFMLGLPGTEKDFKAEWSWFRYMLRGRMYAAVLTDNFSDKAGSTVITLKLPPEDGAILRDRYDSVKPGYYMNKEHWNSIWLDGTVPDELIEQLIGISYRLIFKNLTRKVQKEITGE